jgi:hypothetical protein
MLSASTPLMIFDQNVQAQTATLEIPYTCENGVATGSFILSGFPEGNVILNRTGLLPGFIVGGIFVPSTGTATLGPIGLPVGTFTWTAFSDANNNGILNPGEVVATNSNPINCGQPPPPSPPQQIQNLINTINEMNINNNIKNSLMAPLNQAVNILTDNNPRNDVAVCNQLNAFIQQVNAQTQNHKLTQEQANQLIQSAQSIQNSLGCS